MRTRWDELAAQFERLARAFGIGDVDLLRDVVARTGWAERSVDAPLLPSGVRHGVPWGLSIALGESLELRVFLEAHGLPAQRELVTPWAALPDAFREAPRVWHAIGFARDRAPRFHAYACIPDRPHLARAIAGDLPLVRGARVTIASADLHGPRRKVYALVDALDELPPDYQAFARAMTDRPIGWLVCRGTAPDSLTLHFGAAVHADAGFRARLATFLRERRLDADHTRARDALGDPRYHFVAYARDRVAVYFLPEVAR